MLLRNKESEHMKELKTKSLEIFQPMNNELFEKTSKTSSRKSTNRNKTPGRQPKGAPLKIEKEKGKNE